MSTPEERRLASLQLYQILDTAQERVFDDLTQLASTLCDAPISLISIVDRERQWFKSRHGLPVSETPRDQAFCAHAIKDTQIMIVEDAMADARFFDNPLVTGDPEIRFYAGAPLIIQSGDCLGTLCVIDREPRTLSALQQKSLSILRDAVVAQLELRRAALEIQALRSLLPLCAWCHRVQEPGADESAAWRPLHEYVAEATMVTHGICPDCTEQSFSVPPI